MSYGINKIHFRTPTHILRQSFLILLSFGFDVQQTEKVTLLPNWTAFTATRVDSNNTPLSYRNKL